MAVRESPDDEIKLKPCIHRLGLISGFRRRSLSQETRKGTFKTTSDLYPIPIPGTCADQNPALSLPFYFSTFRTYFHLSERRAL